MRYKMRLLNAILNNNNIDRIPFWYMRQAGRYLPEYNQVKGNLNFLELSTHIEKAIEISIQPYKRFQMDGIIIFADILTPLHGAGIPLSFIENTGPVIEYEINNIEHNKKIKDFIPEKQIPYIKDIIHGIKDFIHNTDKNISLIGFAGAPFTLLSYLVEGKTSKKFEKTKEFLFYFEKQFHELMESLTTLTITYLNYQIKAGVDIIQIFDSWGGILSLEHYKEFCYPYMEKILQELKSKIPIILFVGNNSHLLPLLIKLEPNCISLDWRANDISIIPDHIAIQGNLDPLILYGTPERVKKETLHVLNRFSIRRNYVFNLGHGIYPNTPLYNVEVMVQTIKQYSLNK